MKKYFFRSQTIYLLVFALINVSSVALVWSTEKFVTGFSDLPIMPGMQELPDANISFDTASGRIVEAFAKTEQSVEKILSFYKNVLPQLGWRVENDTTFVRDTEILILAFSAIKSRPARLNYSVHFITTPIFLTCLSFSSVNHKVMLKVTNISVCLSVIPKG